MFQSLILQVFKPKSFFTLHTCPIFSKNEKKPFKYQLKSKRFKRVKKPWFYFHACLLDKNLVREKKILVKTKITFLCYNFLLDFFRSQKIKFLLPKFTGPKTLFLRKGRERGWKIPFISFLTLICSLFSKRVAKLERFAFGRTRTDTSKDTSS